MAMDASSAGTGEAPLPAELTVAVVIERQAQPNRWEDWRFRIAEVLVPEAPGCFGTAPRLLRDDGRFASWLYPGYEVALHRDECEGYHLNLSSGAPVWFVMWRVEEESATQGEPSPRARPEVVTVSYNEAGRWLDAQERVDNVPMPPEVVAWLQAYTDAHYRPEPRQRRRPQSFLRPEERR